MVSSFIATEGTNYYYFPGLVDKVRFWVPPINRQCLEFRRKVHSTTLQIGIQLTSLSLYWYIKCWANAHFIVVLFSSTRYRKHALPPLRYKCNMIPLKVNIYMLHTVAARCLIFFSLHISSSFSTSRCIPRIATCYIHDTRGRGSKISVKTLLFPLSTEF